MCLLHFYIFQIVLNSPTTFEHKPFSRFHCLFLKERNYQLTSSLSYETPAAIGFDALLWAGFLFSNQSYSMKLFFSFLQSRIIVSFPVINATGNPPGGCNH